MPTLASGTGNKSFEVTCSGIGVSATAYATISPQPQLTFYKLDGTTPFPSGVVPTVSPGECMKLEVTGANGTLWKDYSLSFNSKYFNVTTDLQEKNTIDTGDILTTLVKGSGTFYIWGKQATANPTPTITLRYALTDIVSQLVTVKGSWDWNTVQDLLYKTVAGKEALTTVLTARSKPQTFITVYRAPQLAQQSSEADAVQLGGLYLPRRDSNIGPTLFLSENPVQLAK